MSLLLDRLLAQSQFRKMQVKKFQASVEEEEKQYQKKKKERNIVKNRVGLCIVLCDTLMAV